MAPTAGTQQSLVVPFLQIGDVVMAVGSQWAEESDFMIGIIILI